MSENKLTVNDLPLVDFSEWELFSDRHNSRVYNSRDGRSILKFYNEGFAVSLEALLEEQRISQAVLQCGVSTPQAGDIVRTAEGEFGLIFERIQGKVSFSRAYQEQPERLEELAGRFARLTKSLHDAECNCEVFSSLKARYQRIIPNSNLVSEEERAKVKRFIDAIPDVTTCVHGDLQPSNAILNGESEYLIDLGDFSWGSPYFDLGTLYMFMNMFPDEEAEKYVRVNHITGPAFWNAFLRHYCGTTDESELAAKNAEIRPYAGLLMFLWESRRGIFPFMRPIFEACLLPVL